MTLLLYFWARTQKGSINNVLQYDTTTLMIATMAVLCCLEQGNKKRERKLEQKIYSQKYRSPTLTFKACSPPYLLQRLQDALPLSQLLDAQGYFVPCSFGHVLCREHRGKGMLKRGSKGHLCSPGFRGVVVLACTPPARLHPLRMNGAQGCSSPRGKVTEGSAGVPETNAPQPCRSCTKTRVPWLPFGGMNF